MSYAYEAGSVPIPLPGGFQANITPPEPAIYRQNDGRKPFYHGGTTSGPMFNPAAGGPGSRLGGSTGPPMSWQHLSPSGQHPSTFGKHVTSVPRDRRGSAIDTEAKENDYTGAEESEQDHTVGAGIKQGDETGTTAEGEQRKAVGGVETDIQRDTTGVVQPEVRCRMWFMFLVEKLASANCIAFELYSLDVCFDQVVLNIFDDDSLGSTEVAELIDYEASRTYDIVRFTLLFGLVVEFISAVVLSRAYRTPLDIKSVQKIPVTDMRTCGGNVMIFFLAPFSWAIIYLLGGFVSFSYGIHASCEGNGGQVLDVYLAISGIVMGLVGVVLLLTSVVALCISFGSPSRCTDGCCATARRKVSDTILSKGAFFEIFGILQGVVWSYRTGDPTQTILAVMIVSLGLAVFCSSGKVAVKYVFSQPYSK